MSNRNRRLNRQREEQERRLHAETVFTELPGIPFEELLDETIWLHNEGKGRAAWGRVERDTDRDTLERLCVNHARHLLCGGYDASYHRTLYRLPPPEAGKAAKKMALALIAMKWPELAEECRRQLRESGY